MTTILEWLSIGGLTSDGQANEVADLVNENITLLPDLMQALADPADNLRGHAADALEKVARRHPEAVAHHLPVLLLSARSDPVPMVRWHLAMTLGHLAATAGHEVEITEALLRLLKDNSVFVQNWAIASLCIIARLYSGQSSRIAQAIDNLSRSPSAAVRTRVRKALSLLSDPRAPFPKSWVKSQHIKL